MKESTPGHSPFMIVISGPSGSGKSSITRKLLDGDRSIHYSVSMTTRPLRKTEKDGVDYMFTTIEEFQKKMNEGEFIESAFVHGSYYGTLRTPILDAFASGKNILLDIDVQGGRQIREKFDNGVFVFVLPPALDELKRRLRGRMTDREEVIERRLREAGREVRELVHYDYLVPNLDLNEAVMQVRAIIAAEACRVNRMRGAEEWIRRFQSGEERGEG